MTTKDTSIALVPIVNNPTNHDGLIAYANERLELMRKGLEDSTNMETILRTQGAIKELRRLLGLRDEVNTELEKK